MTGSVGSHDEHKTKDGDHGDSHYVVHDSCEREAGPGVSGIVRDIPTEIGVENSSAQPLNPILHPSTLYHPIRAQHPR